ncbi:ATP-binding cassette domain-containing protein [Pseudomonas sp. BN417]|uniref:AAA family ATPase n=1 Tax=Pseudomonas sp. BN417 TaxID=2567890 RepID=UPI002457580D|nr:AAA family ATPase [Pseudomonas sp. BN417]MDH4555718.1 ATP-binding cassette domain-containing protein [Pseudomonas sp. BN417]
MLKSASIQSFGPLPNAEFRFAPGLNVVVGENGCGKSQLLKLLYSLLKVQADSRELSKTALQKSCADKLVGVFRPESLGRLVQRLQGQSKCEIALRMETSAHNLSISFATRATTAVQVEKSPKIGLDKSPVYLPTRELVTLCPWFVPLYDNYHLEFEESWRDTVSLLGNPTIKGKREATVARLVKPLEEAMGGKVVVDSATGRFYLQVPGEGKMEMPLVAEGLRKMAMLARLISTGTLLEQGYLFWDEPETNLNPKLIKIIALSIMSLCSQGIQVFVASHSLFLLRELEILAEKPEFKAVKQRYFSLKATAQGIELEQGDSPDEIQTLVLLDEELKQSDRFIGLEG